MRKYVLVLFVISIVACNHTGSTNNQAQQDSADAAIIDTATAGMNKTESVNDSTAENALPSDHKVIDTSDAPLPALANYNGELKLDKIEGIPDFIQGCTDGSAASEKDLEAEHYVFVSDGQHIGMLKVNGVQVFLRSDASRSKSDKEIWYVGHGYTVHISLEHQKTIADTDSFTYDGTLEVEHAGRKIKMAIWGDGVC